MCLFQAYGVKKWNFSKEVNKVKLLLLYIIQFQLLLVSASDQYGVYLFKKQLMPALTFIFYTLHRPTAY